MEQINGTLKQRFDRIIIENEMLKAGFAALPYLVMKDTTLSVGARLTYAFLLKYAWQDGGTWVGQRQMAQEMGVSERQLRRYITELVNRYYVEISRTDRRFNNTYILKEVATKLRKRNGTNRARADTGVLSERT